MIDVRDIMNDNYTGYYKLCKEEFLNKKRVMIGEKEVNAGLTSIVCGIPTIIQSTLEYANSLNDFLSVIPRIRDDILNIERQKSRKRMNHLYRDLYDFLNKDSEGVQEILELRKVTIDREKMPAYMECMREITIDCVEFCLDKFRMDIENYQAKTRVTWSQKLEVAQIVDRKHHEGQKVKKRGFEDLEDNAGKRAEWRAKIRSKKLSGNQENKSPNL